MRIGSLAQHLVQVHSNDELQEAVAWAEARELPILVLGGGSNVIFKDGYFGLIIINCIPGFTVQQQDEQGTTLCIGAGENWDSVVARTVQMGLTGIEALSAIPGTAGATPVQNVGAYGQEIADTFVSLEAYDLTSHQFITLTKQACRFTYRGSRFKSPENRRYIITAITLRLRFANPEPPFYPALQTYLDTHNISDYTPATIRDAVIAIRATKLPDPAKLANTGSFFKNPIVPVETATPLIARYPGIPHWPTPDGHIKLAAGWLVEHAGLKGYAAHGMRVHENNALVFINESAKDYAALAQFRDEVIARVQGIFGVVLEQEPELL